MGVLPWVRVGSLLCPNGHSRRGLPMLRVRAHGGFFSSVTGGRSESGLRPGEKCGLGIANCGVEDSCGGAASGEAAPVVCLHRGRAGREDARPAPFRRMAEGER